MSNKVKVPGGAFYLGDGLTVDPITRTVSAGGSGVQPDWNQNDSTALDYIKNRPFYTGDPVETVLVEEATVTFTDNDGRYKGDLLLTFEATVGETYKVSWDDTAYECTCVDFNGSPVIGNLSIAGAGSDTGEPFLMLLVVNDKRILIATEDTSASHTISISGFGAPAVTKIDEKYFPDTLATKLYVDEKISDTEIFLKSSTSGSTKKFKITVDDSGTISATEVTA